MTLRAGRLRDRVTIERTGPETDDGYTKLPGGWLPLATVSAEVIYGLGQERRAAAQEGATLPATFRVRRSSVTAGVTPVDRIVFQGGNWDISSVVPLGRDVIEITAVRNT